MLSICVFASGRGSNLQALLEAIAAGRVAARVVLVVSNKSAAGALEIARAHGIAASHTSQTHFRDEADYCRHLLDLLHAHRCDFIVLAGYLKKVPADVVQAYQERIINIHPALLPSFGGKGLYGHHVHEAVLAYGCKVSGATVHLVDLEYDTGAPILQKCVPVLETDDADTLAARVLEAEHEILPQAVQLFAEGRVTIQGHRARIAPNPR